MKVEGHLEPPRFVIHDRNSVQLAVVHTKVSMFIFLFNEQRRAAAAIFGYLNHSFFKHLGYLTCHVVPDDRRLTGSMIEDRTCCFSVDCHLQNIGTTDSSFKKLGFFNVLLLLWGEYMLGVWRFTQVRALGHISHGLLGHAPVVHESDHRVIELAISRARARGR